MFLSSFAILAMAQQIGGTIEAIYPDDPTTWTLDYPVRIQPQVQDYYNCLRSGSYVIGGGKSFGEQHSADVPRCAKKKAALEAEANAALAKADEAGATPPEEVASIFDRARRIHIARGQSLDLANRTRFAPGVSTGDTNNACFASVQTLLDQRKSYIQAEDLRVEAIVGKQRYTEEEKAILDRYSAQLRRYDELIGTERERCMAGATTAGEDALAETQDTTNSNAED